VYSVTAGVVKRKKKAPIESERRPVSRNVVAPFPTDRTQRNRRTRKAVPLGAVYRVGVDGAEKPLRVNLKGGMKKGSPLGGGGFRKKTPKQSVGSLEKP